jgi:beta-galactosidase/beta-glucuronidase
MKSYIKDYPRPQLVRDASSWENLNGSWDFAFDDDGVGIEQGWHKSLTKQSEILVPFTLETELSGIGDEKQHDHVWYSRTINVDDAKLEGNQLFIHFEGSDYVTKVWVNGDYQGSHTGGYARFSFDITASVQLGENIITVMVTDLSDEQQTRGKQRWIDKNFGCWYVQTTGIWKTVWLEYAPITRVENLKLTPKLSETKIEIECDVESHHYGKDITIEAIVTYNGNFINSCNVTVLKKHMKLSVDLYNSQETEWGIHRWTPDNPELYDLELRLNRNGKAVDVVLSYFGMREIRIDGQNILLNGYPIYQRLMLDQGYWKDSHLTPPSEDALIADIDHIKRLGYNGLRKHQKTEDERFLYWCDVKGMLVWSEMAAAYEYSDCAVERFITEWMEIVRQNYNHPSIITWTPINESWGVREIKTNQTQQKFTEAVYYLTKSFDPYRPVIVNDGWEHTISDIITLHDYTEKGEELLKRYTEYKDEVLGNKLYHSLDRSAFAEGYGYHGQPVIISEYGGIAFNNDDNGWGYGNKVTSEKDFIARFDAITTAIKQIPYCSGYCYTQLTDVQQEINGLMTIDRQFKVNPDEISEINLRQVSICHRQ